MKALAIIRKYPPLMIIKIKEKTNPKPPPQQQKPSQKQFCPIWIRKNIF
jgi:hypothetical protein